MILNEALHFAPELAAVAGYAGGQVAEHVARGKIAANRSALMGAHENVGSASLGKQGILRRATAQLAIIGAIAGFSAGQALAPEEGPNNGNGPVISMAIDNPYAAGLDGGAQRANAIATRFEDANGINVQALVAHNGDYGPIEISDLSTDRPYGPSSIDTAAAASITNAFNSARSTNTGQSSGERSAAGVFIITDGNPIGKTKTVISRAKQNGDVPVYIANVSKQGGPVAKNLAEIAEKTGGEYWGPEADPQDIAGKIKKDVKKQQPPHEEAPKDRLPWIAVFIGTVGLGIRKFTDRKEETAVS